MKLRSSDRWFGYTRLDEAQLEERLRSLVGPREPHLHRLAHGVSHPYAGEVRPRRARFVRNYISKNSFLISTELEWRPNPAGGCDVRVSSSLLPLSWVVWLIFGAGMLPTTLSLGAGLALTVFRDLLLGAAPAGALAMLALGGAIVAGCAVYGIAPFWLIGRGFPRIEAMLRDAIAVERRG